MADKSDATTTSQFNVGGFAQGMERIGLAIMGALGGLFVAALVARANIEEINSLGALFSVILYGSVGFYFGTNIPLPASGAPSRTFSDTGSGQGAHPIALASALGTFVAAVAALLSVYLIVFDETPPMIWSVGIGFGWMLGVLLQLAAGTVARLRQFKGAPG
jgi:hypothetical protein